MENILEEIRTERKRQDEKWGEQNHHPFEWCTILGEEFGEVCRGAFESSYNTSKEEVQKYRKECIEVAAVAVAMVENLDRNIAKFIPKYSKEIE